jgi:formamidopyrimidine-DNA glycosylase
LPELPEVETTARSLRPRLIGRRVMGVSGVDWPRMLPNTSEADLNTGLKRRRITTVDRRGKYLLIGFDKDRWLAVHRKMSGNLLLQDAGVPRANHTHLVLTLDDRMEVRFVDARKFGRVYLFRSRDELETFLSERLGPDSLLELDGAVLAEKLHLRKGRIKPLLLDQAFLAGVGNLYADEALWDARVHPLRAASTLSPREVRKIARAIKDVFTAAIERRGTSFSTYRDSDGSEGENQEFLNVYGRAGLPCPRCGCPISRILIGQRSSHYCPVCQGLLSS